MRYLLTSEDMKYIELINDHKVFNNNSVYIDLSFQISPVIDDESLKNILENDETVKELWDNYGDFDIEDYSDRCVSVILIKILHLKIDYIIMKN